MELGKYFKPKSQRQLELNSTSKIVKSTSNAKQAMKRKEKNLLDPFGSPPMGWMRHDKIMSLMADRDAELRAKAKRN